MKIKILVLLLAVASLSGAYFYFSSGSKTSGKYPDVDLSPVGLTPGSNPTPSAESKKLNSSESTERLLMSRDVDGGQISAYRLEGEGKYITNFSDVFVVTLEVGEEYHPTVFSVSSPHLGNGDDLFQLMRDDELWVINAQTRSIEIYYYQPQKIVNNATYLSNFTYKESIELPKYQVGNLYSIKCGDASCTLRTAFHQESGCTMDFNVKTREFSNIKCLHPRGDEFPPEPYLF